MEAWKGLDTVHTVAAKYEVHPVQVSTWKKELKENLAAVFTTRRDRDPVEHAHKMLEYIKRLVNSK